VVRVFAVGLQQVFFQQNLRAIRKKSGLTQGEVAASLGCHASMVSAWETGRVEPSLSTLRKLAFLYQVPLKRLVQ